jgi:hypothetical protein
MRTLFLPLLVVAALAHTTVAAADDGGADAATMGSGGAGGTAGSGGMGGAGGAGGVPSEVGLPVVQRAATPDPTACSLSAGRDAGSAGDACALGLALATAGLARRRRR